VVAAAKTIEAAFDMASPNSSPSASAPAPHASIAAFLDEVRAAIAVGAFGSVVLSKPRQSGAGPRAVRLRLISLQGAPALSFVSEHATRDVTRNFPVDGGIAELAALIQPGRAFAFAHATLHRSGADVQLLVSKKGKATLRRHAADSDVDAGPAVEALAPHDRARARRLPLDLPFLVPLGLTDDSHRLVPAMARKWRQIDKFLEVLDHALDALPEAALGDGAAPIRVVDYGSGKGYLTFAVHEHLRRRFGRPPAVTGVELRGELVEFCNAVAARSGCDGLSFVQGDLRSVAPAQMDVMIALHACDTATDHAIDLGLSAGAQILVCSPCCHKELRPQMARPQLLSGLLRHGIHLGQEAEMVTDSMRALLLETRGYEAQVFEFVSLEHTSKNKMILARRRAAGSGQEARARSELDGLKSFYGIREQRLESLLEQRRAAAGDPAAQACQTP
jgi:SAM-dependent methyltransferase